MAEPLFTATAMAAQAEKHLGRPFLLRPWPALVVTGFIGLAAIGGIAAVAIWPVSGRLPLNGTIVADPPSLVIEAPEAAIVESLLVSPGDRVSAGQPLLRLVPMTSVWRREGESAAAPTVLHAPRSGIVRLDGLTSGASVGRGRLVVSIDHESARLTAHLRSARDPGAHLRMGATLTLAHHGATGERQIAAVVEDIRSDAPHAEPRGYTVIAAIATEAAAAAAGGDAVVGELTFRERSWLERLVGRRGGLE